MKQRENREEKHVGRGNEMWLMMTEEIVEKLEKIVTINQPSIRKYLTIRILVILIEKKTQKIIMGVMAGTFYLVSF